MTARELIRALRIFPPEADVELFPVSGERVSRGIDRIDVAYATERGTFGLDDLPHGLGATAKPVICLWPKLA